MKSIIRKEECKIMQIHQRKKKEIRHITDEPEIYSDDSNEG